MNDTDRVRSALVATPADYLDRTIAARSGTMPTHAANHFPGQSPEQVFDALWSATWKPFTHDAVKAPNVAFVASIPGISGIVPLKALDANAKLVLVPSKDPAMLEAQIATPHSGSKTTSTIVILGPTDKVETVWSIDPGEPVAPSTFQTIEGLAGAQMSVQEAKGLGLTWAKVAPAK